MEDQEQIKNNIKNIVHRGARNGYFYRVGRKYSVTPIEETQKAPTRNQQESEDDDEDMDMEEAQDDANTGEPSDKMARKRKPAKQRKSPAQRKTPAKMVSWEEDEHVEAEMPTPKRMRKTAVRKTTKPTTQRARKMSPKTTGKRRVGKAKRAAPKRPASKAKKTKRAQKMGH